MKIRTFYTILGFMVGILLSWDMMWAKSFDMNKAGITLWIGFAVCLFVIALELVPMIIMLTTYLDYRKNKTGHLLNWKLMESKALFSATGAIVGLIFGVNSVWARSIDLSQAGVAFWIFLALGTFIVLLQLIPAFILFFAFIAATAKKAHEKDPAKDEAKEDKTQEVKS